MLEKIQPYLQEIITKSLPEGGLIYYCLPKRGVKVSPLGYWKTEFESIEAFYNELIKRGIINE